MNRLHLLLRHHTGPAVGGGCMGPGEQAYCHNRPVLQYTAPHGNRRARILCCAITRLVHDAVHRPVQEQAVVVRA